MRVWVLTMLALTALAGCAEEAPEPVEDDEAFDGLEAQATEDTGIIRGVVLDPAIVPIEGATVRIEGNDMTTVSNEAGAFAFSGLTPGTYFLSIERLGFQSTQSSADVVAGDSAPPVVKIQMIPDPTTVPFASTFVYDAYIQCSESVIVVGYSGGCDNNFLVNYEKDVLGRTPDFAQSEMLWDSTQALGEWMNVMYSSPGDGALLFNYVEDEGPSPLVIRANQTLMLDNGVVDDYPLQVRIFNSGIEGSDLGRDYGDPVDGDNCIERPVLGGCTTGIGATVDQVLTVYTHAFYNFLPDEGWQFSVDGDPVPPL